MASLALAARPRTTLGKAVARLRREGITPANVYGHNVPSLAIELDEHTVAQALRRAGRTKLIQLSIEGEPQPRAVLVKDVTRRATTDQLLHVDFFQVSLLETLTVQVPLRFVGEAPAVKSAGSIVVPQLEHLNVECLPTDIPSHIDVDLTVLVDGGSAIHVRELSIPAGITVLDDSDAVVVAATGETTETEEAAEETPTEVPTVRETREEE